MAAPKATIQKDPDTQYQHFIPRFVLRSFFDPASIPSNGSTPPGIVPPRIPLPPKAVDPITENEANNAQSAQQNKKKSKRRGKKWKLDVKNPPLKFYDMETETRSLHYTSRCYGIIDMYRDISQLKDQQHIEKMLSELEAISAKIVARILQAVDAITGGDGRKVVNLTRIERNSLRKFIFVMKYRTALFFHKYNHHTLATYEAVDKDSLTQFMRKTKISSPRMVWLNNLKTILETHIDAEGTWVHDVRETMFVHDANWFIFNMQESYMAFVTPGDEVIAEEGEFILSESAFGIHEGPTEGPGASGETGGGEFIEYHKLAPLSPRLLLVLRSNFLRKGNEGVYDQLRQMTEKLTSSAGKKLMATPSVFAGLELEPATPSYGLNLPVHRFKPKDDDLFAFKIQKINSKYLHLFNTIILAEAKVSLTWKTDKAMKNTLKEYLDNEDFKLPGDLRWIAGIPGKEATDLIKQWNIFLYRRKKICRLFTLLGGSVPTGDGHHYQGYKEHQQRLLSQPSLQGYFLLGGTPDTFPSDFTQSRLISHMRCIIADALPGGPQNLMYRSIVFRNQMQFYALLPPRIVFLHCKFWRAGQNHRDGLPVDSLFTEKTLHGKSPVKIPDGAEDVLPPLAHKLPKTVLSLLLLQTTLAQVEHQRNLHSGKHIAEFSLFSNFGGIRSSWLVSPIEGLYKPEIGAQIVSWKREVNVNRDEFSLEMKVRLQLKRNGVIERLWGMEVGDWVWKWLYYVPDGKGGLDSW